MDNITEQQLEEFRGALEAEKDSLEEELSTYGKKVGGDWEGKSESEGIDADANDAADNIEELVKNVPLVEELEKRYNEVRGALERIKKGGYGKCAKCGEDIPLKRLDANPAALTCVNHTA
ncbi:MAG: TraR/DksA C4-type zinc finger protein [Patescibacteria group bacterium]|nr:TraR/DksA C4-type zinc finger protein [bacterium]MDZ4227487.1 TraR/DksA C4-type zinc finger protein [Patescibacteria group bacterium]